MNTNQQRMHGHPDNPGLHTHDHSAGGIRSSLHNGLSRMGILGLLPLIAHDQTWLSDYRPSRLVPASDRVILGTIVVLVLGVVGWHILPPASNGIALGIIIAAVAHLALLVVGGLSVTLFMRHLRTTIRNGVVNSIPWQGTEHVLDVGCGTGMLLNGCARKLTTGHATGIDLWQEAIAGSQAVLRANSVAEGVADRVDYQSMDARLLTFPDASFDVVVSSAALHHIGSEHADKEKALSEMIRVLSPGGTLSLSDVGPMMDIAEAAIARAGLETVRRQSNRFFRTVTARKAR